MPSRFRLRKIFAPVVKFMAKGFIKIKVTPNIATLLMVFCACMSALSLILWESLLLYGVWIFITGLMDGVDGAIARLTGQGSKFGAFFDSSMDRLSEGIIYSALLVKMDLLFDIPEIWSVLLIGMCLLFSFLISYTRARLELIGKREKINFDSNIGLMGRSERLFFLFLSNMIVGLFHIELLIFIIIYLVLILTTAIYRFIKYQQFIESIEKKL
ncbi:CDP-alcohol phosphatidyltransferase family protein [Candidatus Lokiarchaeum ossiferum]|uniref:CDP-alcohol phosphatidyltransferase family protein n=1 Tax=Candidatus Lokiarchaeum ossiferum TaxID=2951803 RepID=UPI00352F5C6E